MAYAWPRFDRQGSIDSNYRMMLFCLCLLDEAEDSADALAAAEAMLAQLMPTYKVCDEDLVVGEGRFKTAAFFYALSLDKGELSFNMTEVDINRLSNYLTDSIIEDARANPGKHTVVDLAVLGDDKPIIYIGE